MEDIPDIPLSEMERLDDEMFAALDAAELEDVMAMEEESEDIFRPMYEVEIDEKYERCPQNSISLLLRTAGVLKVSILGTVSCWTVSLQYMLSVTGTWLRECGPQMNL